MLTDINLGSMRMYLEDDCSESLIQPAGLHFKRNSDLQKRDAFDNDVLSAFCAFVAHSDKGAPNFTAILGNVRNISSCTIIINVSVSDSRQQGQSEEVLHEKWELYFLSQIVDIYYILQTIKPN